MRILRLLRLPTLLVSILQLVSVGSSALAQPDANRPTDMRVGLASSKVTPEFPVRMSGYAGRQEPSNGVKHDLYVKALALEDASGNRAVLVTSDVIGFRARFAEATCRRITKATGLKRKQILLNSSHTHTGPTISLDAASLNFPDDQKTATVRYSQMLQDRMVETVEASLKDLAPAKLSRGTGVARFVMNRREPTDNGVILGFNPRGHVDRSVPVLRIDGPDGKLRGVLFGAACHNTTLTGKHFDISGDFAGYAQTAIEKKYPEAMALFMQGCAGDANPHPRGTEEIAQLHGRALGAEVAAVLESDVTPISGTLQTELEMIALPLQHQITWSQIEQLAKGRGGWRRFVSGEMLRHLEEHGKLPQSYAAPFAVWQIGNDLTLIGLPGEVVVDYVRLIEQAVGPRRLWIAAYCNDVFGYLPARSTLAEGGYETRGMYSGSVGLFAPQAESTTVDAVRRLAEQVGRPAELFDRN